MKSSGKIRGLAKTTFIYGLIGGSRSLIELFLLPIYARYLTPGEFGIFDILMLIMMIGGVAAMMELGNAVFRFYFDSESHDYRKSVVTSAAAAMTINAAAISALLLIFSRYLSSALFQSVEYSHLIALAAAYIIMNSIITVPINLLRIKNQPGRFVAVSLTQIFASVAGIIVFVVMMRLGLAGVLTAKVVSTLPALVLGFHYSRDDIGARPDFALVKKMLKYSVPLIPAGVAIWGINGINRLFMLRFLDLEQIGFFSVASKFVAVLTLAVIAFQLAWPHFSLSNMNAPESASMFGRVFSILAAGGVWMIMALTLFAGPVILMFLTPEYMPAAGAVLPLALGMFLYSLFYFFSTGCVFSKNTRRVMPPIGLAVCVNLLLNIMITPRFGFGGTAWVTAVSYLVMAAVMFIFTRKSGYIEFDFPKLYLLAGLAVPAVMTCVWLAGRHDHYGPWPGLLLLVLFPALVISTGIVALPRTSAVEHGQPDDIPELTEKERWVESSVD